MNETKQPGMRRTFIDLGRKAFARRQSPAPKSSFRISAGKAILLFKLGFIAFALAFCLYAASRFLPGDWSLFGKADPAVAASVKAGAVRAAEGFWTSCKRNPLEIRSLFSGMTTAEFAAIRESLANAGEPSFDKASVWMAPHEPGMCHVDVPVNGGTLSLVAHEKDGAWAVSAFMGVNMN